MLETLRGEFSAHMIVSRMTHGRGYIQANFHRNLADWLEGMTSTRAGHRSALNSTCEKHVWKINEESLSNFSFKLLL